MSARDPQPATSNASALAIRRRAQLCRHRTAIARTRPGTGAPRLE